MQQPWFTTAASSTVLARVPNEYQSPQEALVAPVAICRSNRLGPHERNTKNPITTRMPDMERVPLIWRGLGEVFGNEIINPHAKSNFFHILIHDFFKAEPHEMKNKFSLSVKTPCSENWSNFSKTTTGGFCNSCEKNVVDFSKMTDSEIISFFSRKPAHVCGRFQPSQLRTYREVSGPQKRQTAKWLPAGLLGLITLLEPSFGYSKSDQVPTSTEQTESSVNEERESQHNPGPVVRGRVVDPEYKNEPLPGVSVYLKGGSVGTVTDINGEFVFPQPLNPGDIIVVSFIGYVTEEYKVPKDAAELLEINVTLKMVMDIMGEVAVDHLYVAKANPIQKAWQKLAAWF